ncbi:hypothetical protein Franean1_1417 [Parafrankia sp. EAN1pec]|nr:hypothetical protein Franean1_1417 [Frankia sp. EAN1pec]
MDVSQQTSGRFAGLTWRGHLIVHDEAAGVPVEEKVRTVLSVLAGEVTVAEAARRAKVPERSGGTWKRQHLESSALSPPSRPARARTAQRSTPPDQDKDLAKSGRLPAMVFSRERAAGIAAAGEVEADGRADQPP